MNLFAWTRCQLKIGVACCHASAEIKSIKASIESFIDDIVIEINIIGEAVFKSILIITKCFEGFCLIWIHFINSKSIIDFYFFGCALEYRCELARVIGKICLIATFIEEKLEVR